MASREEEFLDEAPGDVQELIYSDTEVFIDSDDDESSSTRNSDSTNNQVDDRIQENPTSVYKSTLSCCMSYVLNE